MVHLKTRMKILIPALVILAWRSRTVYGSPIPPATTTTVSTPRTQATMRTGSPYLTKLASTIINVTTSPPRRTSSSPLIRTSPKTTQRPIVQVSTSPSSSATATRRSTSTTISQSSEVISTSQAVNTSPTANTECHCFNNESCNSTSWACAENTSCDPDTLRCTGGCLAGWHGDRCDQGISPTTPSNRDSAPLSPRDIAILILTLLFVVSLAVNIFIVVRKVRSHWALSAPVKSYDVARYKPEEDGQVNLTRDGSLSSLDYQPSAILSGLPGEEYEFVEPEAVTYIRNSRGPPPIPTKVERPQSRLSRGEDPRSQPEVRQTGPTDVGVDSLHQVEQGAGPLENISDVAESGEYSFIHSGAHGPGAYVRNDQRSQQPPPGSQRQDAPLRPPRRSKKSEPTREDTDAGENNVAYRRDSEDVSGRRFSETSEGMKKRRSGVYTAPEDGLAYSGSEYAGSSGDEDESYEKYQRALLKAGVQTREETSGNADDDSDPYENEDFMDKLYRQRADRRRAELETGDATVQEPEDDTDLYENEENLDTYRERARAREAMRRREETTDVSHVEDQDDSDPYEDYADMEQMYRQKITEKQKVAEVETDEVSRKYEEDDSDPYENDEDMEEMYRQRAQQRLNEKLEKDEIESEIDETNRGYEDDSDPYENEDFLEKLYKERTSQMSTKGDDDQNIHEDNGQDEEDELYENEDFIDQMSRRREERKLDKQHSMTFDLNSANKSDGYSKVIRRHSEGSKPTPVPSGLPLYGTSERLNTICDEEGERVQMGLLGGAQDQDVMREEEGDQPFHFESTLPSDHHYGQEMNREEGSDREGENEHLDNEESFSTQPAFNDELRVLGNNPHELGDISDTAADMEQMCGQVQTEGYDFTQEQYERDDEVVSKDHDTNWEGFNDRPTRPSNLPVNPILPNNEISSQSGTDNVWPQSPRVASENDWQRNPSSDTENSWPQSQSSDTENVWPKSSSNDTDNAWLQSPSNNTETTWERSPMNDTENAWTQSPSSDTENAWPQSPTSDTEKSLPENHTTDVGFEENFVTNVTKRRENPESRHAQFRWSVSETEEEGQRSGNDLDGWSRALDIHPSSESPVQFESDNEEFDA